MAGISPKLPLSLDESDGYALNKTFRDAMKQNFKMLILTTPGERVMIPDFGVGIRRYLFENADEFTYAEIKQNILEQTAAYLPFVKIVSIDIVENGDPLLQISTGTGINLKIQYFIPEILEQDILEISATETN